MGRILLLIIILFQNIAIVKAKMVDFEANFNTNYFYSGKQKFLNELLLKIKTNYKNFSFDIHNRYFDKQGNDFDFILAYKNDSHKIEIGNVNFVSQNLKYGINSLVRNQFNNYNYYFFNNNYNNYLINTNNIINQNFGNINNLKNFYKTQTQPKISYYFYLNEYVTFALSYQKKLKVINYNYVTNLKINDFIDYSLIYNYIFENIYLDLSLTGQHNLKQNNYKINSNDLGANISYLGITFGANYGIIKENISKLIFNNNKLSNSSYYYAFGIGYEIQKFKIFSTYINTTKNDKNKLQSIIFNFHYKYNKFINPYLQYSFITTNSSYNKTDNIIMFGMEIKL